MSEGRMSVRRFALSAVAFAVAGGLLAYGYDDGPAGASGVHAELTRSELGELTARGAARNPVLLPRDLPPTAGGAAGAGFVLVGEPVTAAKPRKAGQVWRSRYAVDALPPETGDASGYSVFQEWLETPERHRPRCGGQGGQSVVRRVGDDRLTICLGPHPTEASRDYWSSVQFTSELSEVDWLR